MLNLNKLTETKPKPEQCSSLRTVHMCVHITVQCTTVIHSTEQFW